MPRIATIATAALLATACAGGDGGPGDSADVPEWRLELLARIGFWMTRIRG
jgi:hypothetical protein